MIQLQIPTHFILSKIIRYFTKVHYIYSNKNGKLIFTSI